MKRLQFIILMFTMLCTGLVMSTIESQANDPPGINIDVANYDVPVENFEFISLSITDEGVFAVYSCDLTLWSGAEYSIIQSNSDIINNITWISVLNKGSTDYSNLYVYTTLLRLNDLKDPHTVNDCWMPTMIHGGTQNLYS